MAKKHFSKDWRNAKALPIGVPLTYISHLGMEKLLAASKDKRLPVIPSEALFHVLGYAEEFEYYELAGVINEELKERGIDTSKLEIEMNPGEAEDFEDDDDLYNKEL